MKSKLFKLTFLLSVLILSACTDESGEQKDDFRRTGDADIDQVSAQIQSSPERAELYAARAELYYDRKGYDEAIADLERARRIDSTNVDYLHLLADVYLDYFRSRKALETMELAANMHPDRIPTLLKLSEFQLILEQQEASLKTLDQVLRRDPQNADAYFMMGQVFKEMGDLKRAINSLQTAVEIEPEMLDAWLDLGRLHASLETGLAERFYDTAIDIDTAGVLALHAKADFMTDANRLPDAIQLYRRSVRKDPQYVSAYINMGMLYLEMDSLAAAEQELTIATQIDPMDARAYYGKGYIAEQQGRIAEARRHYEQALRLAPEFTAVQERLAQLAEE